MIKASKNEKANSERSTEQYEFVPRGVASLCYKTVPRLLALSFVVVALLRTVLESLSRFIISLLLAYPKQSVALSWLCYFNCSSSPPALHKNVFRTARATPDASSDGRQETNKIANFARSSESTNFFTFCESMNRRQSLSSLNVAAIIVSGCLSCLETLSVDGGAAKPGIIQCPLSSVSAH